MLIIEFVTATQKCAAQHIHKQISNFAISTIASESPSNSFSTAFWERSESSFSCFSSVSFISFSSMLLPSVIVAMRFYPNNDAIEVPTDESAEKTADNCR